MRTAFQSSFLLLLLMTVAGTSAALAQGLGAVRGTVKDESGDVVPDAEATLKELHRDWLRTTKTNGSGGFVINGVPLGEYMLTVVHDGFAPISRPVQVLIGSAPTIDITLAVSSGTSSVTIRES